MNQLAGVAGSLQSLCLSIQSRKHYNYKNRDFSKK